MLPCILSILCTVRFCKSDSISLFLECPSLVVAVEQWSWYSHVVQSVNERLSFTLCLSVCEVALSASLPVTYTVFVCV